MGKEDNTALPNDKPKCTWEPHMDMKLSPHSKLSYKQFDKIQPDILHLIGNTPMVKLNKIPKTFGIKCEMYGKCEFFNPGGSIKDRMALRMIEAAEQKGILKPGSVLVEPTAGNTGIGLALVASVKGYRSIMVVPDKTSAEKVNTLRALGTEVVFISGAKGCDEPDGVFGAAHQIAKNTPNGIVLDQFRNPENPLMHFETTAMEIYNQLDGKVDMVVDGAGTGGTLTGVGRRMKELCPECVIIGADPSGSKLAKLHSDYDKDIAVPVEIEGIGRDFIPTTLDGRVVKKWIKCTDQESFEMSRRMIREEGILCGASSGTAMAAALKAASTLKENQRCVVILPDTMQNYLTKHLSDQWLEARNFKEIPQRPELWWWQTKISESGILKQDSNVKSNITVGQAMKLLAERNCEQLSVVDSESGFFVGTVSVVQIIDKLGSGTVKKDSEIKNIVATYCTRVCANDSIGKIIRILEIEPFAIVVKEGEIYAKHVKPLGIVYRMDVLKLILSKCE